MNTPSLSDTPVRLNSRYITVLPDLALSITWTPSGIHHISFHSPRAGIHAVTDSHLPTFASTTFTLLHTYFHGTPTSFSTIPLDIAPATPFQHSVWKACRLIPWGTTRSYRWIAHLIGKPRAARAVGTALGKNPVPIIIPCHRVLRTDGSLAGFSAGLSRKRTLLHLENITQTKSPHKSPPRA